MTTSPEGYCQSKADEAGAALIRSQPISPIGRLSVMAVDSGTCAAAAGTTGTGHHPCRGNRDDVRTLARVEKG